MHYIKGVIIILWQDNIWKAWMIKTNIQYFAQIYNWKSLKSVLGSQLCYYCVNNTHDDEWCNWLIVDF